MGVISFEKGAKRSARGNLRRGRRKCQGRFWEARAYVGRPLKYSSAHRSATPPSRGASHPPVAVACGVFLSPGRHHFEDGGEAFSMARERVFDPGRNLGVDLAADNLVALEFAEFLGEHFLGGLGDQQLQIAKAPGCAFEIEKDEGFPFAA